MRNLCPEIRSIALTPFGVDTEHFSPRPSYTAGGVVTIGTVKTLSRGYGIDILMRAVATARNELRASTMDISLRLLIVGDGPERRKLLSLADDLKLSEITEFCGAVPASRVPDYLNRLDIYVAVSRDESFGVAVLEASSCGLPVIVSNVGGLPEVVLHGATGLVVERENVTETARAIVTLVKDASLRRKLGDAGREYVKSHYEWQENVTRMETVYSDMLSLGFS